MLTLTQTKIKKKNKQDYKRDKTPRGHPTQLLKRLLRQALVANEKERQIVSRLRLQSMHVPTFPFNSHKCTCLQNWKIIVSTTMRVYICTKI